jgi:hypothetical protein
MTRAISPGVEPTLRIGQWVFDPARRLLVGAVGWRALRPRAAAALRGLAREAPAAVDLEALRRGAGARRAVPSASRSDEVARRQRRWGAAASAGQCR